jgi:hypothetical protein
MNLNLYTREAIRGEILRIPFSELLEALRAYVCVSDGGMIDQHVVDLLRDAEVIGVVNTESGNALGEAFVIIKSMSGYQVPRGGVYPITDLYDPFKKVKE